MLSFLLLFTLYILYMSNDSHISDRRNNSETLQNETVVMATETHHLVRNNIAIEEE